MAAPIISIITSMICPLIAMAFYTLLERKGIGYAQARKGPNKVSLAGVPQPLLDALKLFSKEWATPVSANPLMFFFFPLLALLLALALWSLYPSMTSSFIIPFSFMVFLAISSVNVYCTLGSGWASNSKYALLGALRGIAQTISYEVSMALTLLSVLLLFKSLDTHETILKCYLFPLILMPPVAIIWLTTCLAEANRAPFDFAEGESELVSGFNIEYSAGSFALIFLAEYTNMLFLSMLSFIILIPKTIIPTLIIPWAVLMTCFLAWGFIWVRAALPRMRYDRLMSLTWKVFLPSILMILLLIYPLIMI